MRGKIVWSGVIGKVFSVLVFIYLFVPEDVVSSNPPKSGEDCIACHAAVWRDITSKMYVHRPEGEGDCKFCHVEVAGKKGNSSDTFPDKIKWVAKVSNPDREHWLEFDDAKRGASLFVEVRSGGRVKSKEFPLPEFSEIEELPTRNVVPPTISNVRLVEVNKGVFVSATIAWETDAPADSQVLYGVDKLDQTSMLDTQHVKNHAVILTGVQPGKSYVYKVVSVDLVGNRVESAVKNAVFDVSVPEKVGQINQSAESDPEFKIKCYRHGDKSIVVVTADKAVSVRLGILPKKYLDASSSGEEQKVIRHLLLNTQAVTNIGICYSCHIDYKKILSHPVNVYPKRGMMIPPEYATLSDGRITCMSCHANHASNIEFRLVKDRKEALCRGCHRDIP